MINCKTIRKSLSKKTTALVLAVICSMALSDVTTIKASAAINTSSTQEVKWDQTVFGASTSKENNKIEVDDVNKTVTIKAGNKDGSKTGGKVTASNDGISYYYTELDASKNFELTADVKVNYFEKAKPDNQAGFGIMARDVLGVKDDASLSPSNAVLVGGYNGKVESVFRNGVNKDFSDQIVMEGEYKFGERPANDGTATYKLSLKKTNTGYIACVDNGQAQTYYRPDQLEVLDGKIYVGFFAARVASITVSNIEFKTSNAASDPTGIPEPAKVIKPSLSVTSSDDSTERDYDLNLKASINGIVNVKQGDKVLYNGKIKKDDNFKVNAKLVKGDNSLNIKYTPNKENGNTNENPIENSFKVTYKTYGVENGEIYVSQTGKPDGAGTENDPIDIYSALKFAGEGQTIKVKGGTYKLKDQLVIDKSNDGTAAKRKVLTSYGNERAVFDFGKAAKGLYVNGDYWHISKIDVTNSQDKSHGITVAGNNNIIEGVKTYKNGDTGLQISGSNTDKKENWPKNNLILNCDSYDNMDSAMNNADGFAAKLSCGEGNVFKGCISHNNCDDGWDLFTKLESGAISPIIIENCVAYENGTLTDGTVTKGDGNGFKLGGEGISVKNHLIKSLAFNNNTSGIDCNSNPAIIVDDCISVDNGKANIDLHYYTNAKLDFKLNNNISFRTKAGEKDDIPKMVLNSNNYFYDGTVSKNKYNSQIQASKFKSVIIPASIERDHNDNIVLGDYMKK